MRKVFSIALFQPPDATWDGVSFYSNHFPGFLRAFYSCFPGWELWVHHDDSIYNQPNGDTLFRLAAVGKLKLIYCGAVKDICAGMLWRMKPIWEGADIVACRDIDALPYPRDYKVVEHWIANDKSPLHVIHDSESHMGIMGGTTTFRVERFRSEFDAADWHAFIRHGGVHLGRHGTDQVLLNRIFSSMEATLCSRPQRDDVRDRIGPHVGACFPSNQICAFYDAQMPQAPVTIAEMRGAFGDTKIILGCDQHPQYVGGLPLTVLMWRELVGARSVCLLVGNPDEWLELPRMRFVCNKAREAGAELHFIGRGVGHRDATWAQVGRLYAMTLPGIDKGAEFFITSDADMWPLSAPFFGQRAFGHVSLWYANAYGGQKYPLCYVGATSDQWRKMMALDNKPFRQMLQERLDANLGRNEPDAMKAWCFDEVHFATCLTGCQNSSSAVKLHKIDRHGGPPKDRIDRSSWPEAPQVAGMADAHLVRPPEVKYAQVRPLLEQTLKPQWVTWADDYIRDLARL